MNKKNTKPDNPTTSTPLTLTAMDLFFLAKELNTTLTGGKIDKIYQKGTTIFYFTIHVPNKGRHNLYLDLPHALFLTHQKPAFPQTPPGYCIFLRKHLRQARITAIQQEGFERILTITLQRTGETKHLHIELIPPGNLIHTRADGTIISPLHTHTFKDRTIRGGSPYTPPPQATNPLTLTLQELSNIITTTKNESIVKILATKLSLGGKWAEELCQRANIDKNKTTITEADAKKIHEQLSTIATEKPQPHISDQGPTPIPFTTHTNQTATTTFSEAIEKTLMPTILQNEANKKHEEHNHKQTKINRIITEQEKHLRGLEKSAEQNQKKGELIYQHYQELQTILDTINNLKNTKGWEAAKNYAKKHPRIIVIDEHKGTLTIDLPNA
ncbi:hypothetical protein D6783_04655 [Candidatus Woesearchaeota archaeon]|nr:MAG: hypothetical protein D6783_04655 [Candidatus Woesearchaeota archaeon]